MLNTHLLMLRLKLECSKLYAPAHATNQILNTHIRILSYANSKYTLTYSYSQEK